MKIWILTNTPSPYQLELFRAIQADGRALIDVRFMRAEHRGTDILSRTDPGFPFQVLKGLGPASWPDEIRLHPQAVREVRTGSYDAYVLSGLYTSATFTACSIALRRRHVPWAIWLERPWPQDYRPAWSTRLSSRSAAARAIRKKALTGLARSAPAVFGIGMSAVEAYRAMGARPDALHNLPYHCDVDRFNAVDPEDATAIRKRWAMEGKTLFLFSGMLIPRKGPDLLIDAFVRAAEKHPDIALLLLGDGTMRAELDARVPVDLRDRVRFAGHVAQEDLPAYFAAADVFVFPSRHDGWGVVVNEACGAGLPILCTDSVGAASDMVRNGENGYVIPRDDLDALAARISELADDATQRSRMGEASRRIANEFTLEMGVQRFLTGVRKLTEVRS